MISKLLRYTVSGICLDTKSINYRHFPENYQASGLAFSPNPFFLYCRRIPETLFIFSIIELVKTYYGADYKNFYLT